MHQPNSFSLIYHKLSGIKSFFKKKILIWRGLSIEKGTKLGDISCDWPNKLMIGSDCDIQDGVDFRIWHPYDPESYVKIGNKVFIGHSCEFVCNTKITIGNDCLIASRTTFVDVGHGINPSTKMNMQGTIAEEITIEEDVWIGSSCVIIKGVTIGKGSVIAAGSLVNKSVPPYQIWGGVPAKFIKNRN
jgi:acetyltransferase-like isoleucine patch superfamily enzyme